jgi:murein DD-endopeptidase MepM/ murein hydrolase activator NlpD
MTHFLQRSALILLTTSAISASMLAVGPAAARAHHRGHHRAHAAARSEEADVATYTVHRGDTLEKIAPRLGTSIEELRRLNGLRKSSVLRPGQVLKGPATEKTATGGRSGRSSAARAEGKTYLVARGDTLFSISKRLNLSVDDLREANGLSRKARIHAGQTLKLPGEAGAEPAEETASASTRAEGAGRGRRGRASEPSPIDEADGARVVTTRAKGESYKVRRGDTIAKVADRLDTDIATLKRLNHLRGNSVRPGEVLHGPSFAEHVYTAAAGDTLASIAQRFGVSVASLRAENELSRRTFSVRPGQKVYLPDGYRDRTVVAEARPSRSYPQPALPSRGDATLPSHPQPYQPSGPTRPYTPAPGAGTPGPAAAAAPTDAQVTELAKGRFQWPLHGDTLAEFGPMSGGQRNDGINIRADAGAAVRAAADGEVVYAGDKIPGFGNLVLLKHADGWATAYGYLSRIDVKNQEKVTQGQQIGQVGATGGVPQPQLHFEVRYAAHPVDPKLVLPK